MKISVLYSARLRSYAEQHFSIVRRGAAHSTNGERCINILEMTIHYALIYDILIWLFWNRLGGRGENYWRLASGIWNDSREGWGRGSGRGLAFYCVGGRMYIFKRKIWSKIWTTRDIQSFQFKLYPGIINGNYSNRICYSIARCFCEICLLEYNFFPFFLPY